VARAGAVSAQSSGGDVQVAAAAAPTSKGDSTSKAAPAPHAAPAHCDFRPDIDTSVKEPRATVLIPGARVRYLAEIAEQGRAINASIEKQAEAADRAQSFWQSLKELADPRLPKALDLYDAADLLPQQPLPPQQSLPPQSGGSPREAGDGGNPAAAGPPPNPPPHLGEGAPVDRTLLTLRHRYNDATQSLDAAHLRNLRDWPARLKSITADVNEYQLRGKPIRVQNYRESLSHQQLPRIA